MDTTISISRENFSNLESEVVSRITEILDRRSSGSVFPKCDLELEYDGASFSRKYLDLVTLILLCWYSDLFGEFRTYLLYEIRDYLERNLLFPELSAMTISKEISLLIFLSFCKKNNPRILFGVILSSAQIERVLEKVHLRMIQSIRPKRLIRHRGYRDHGTLRPEDHWIERYDYSFTEEQNLKEEKETEYFNLISSIVHLAGDWVLKNHSVQKRKE